MPISYNLPAFFNRRQFSSVYVAPRLKERIWVPKAPLEDIVHKSELLPPTFGDIAEGGGDLTVVSFVPLVVTVEVVVCVIELSSTACTIVGITKMSQKAITIKPAIVLFLALGVT
jgi:hypothetical protein